MKLVLMQVFVSLVLTLLASQFVFGARYFPDDAVWFQDVSNLAPAADSDAIIADLQKAGWGGSGQFHIDFSIPINFVSSANASTITALTTSSGYYYPDCNTDTSIPTPAGALVEGPIDWGKSCSGDCHYLVVDSTRKLIFESFETSGRHSTCVVTWDTCRSYPPNGRGEQCTSADAAGFSITQLLFTADEVATNTLDHAIRFILPNPTMRSKSYVHPASHAGGPSSTSANAIAYGMRLRLKASFDDSNYNTAAKVVIEALKTYGMFLSDGGNIPLTAASDANTVHKWDDMSFDSHSLYGIKPSDFDVMPYDRIINLTYDCVRTNFTSCGSSPITSSSTSPSTSSSSQPSTLIIALCLIVFISFLV